MSSPGYAGNVPALAAPPTISGVTSSVSGDQVTVSATVTGSPSAGIQEVWVSYTGQGAGDPLYGSWQSVDLTQNPSNTTQWTGTFTDKGTTTGTPASDAWFMVQAANGVGEVSLNDNDGYYFTPTFTPGAPAAPSANSYTLALSGATSGTYEGTASVTATLAPVPGQPGADAAGQQITFGLGASTVEATTGAGGSVTVTVPLTQAPGTYTLGASYAGDANDKAAGAQEAFQIVPAPTALTLSAPGQITSGLNSGVSATLTSGSTALAQKPVYFEVTSHGTVVGTGTGITNSVGVAQAGPIAVVPGDVGTGFNITAYFGSSAVVLPNGQIYNATDPDYSPSQAGPAGVTVADSTQTSVVVAPSPSVSGQSLSLSATVSSTNGDGSVPPPDNAASAMAFYQGTSVINGCSAQPVTSGAASCVLSGAQAGSYSFSAAYSGDLPLYLASTSGAVAQTVGMAATATAVVSTTGSPSVAGQTVTYTATVSASAPGSGTPTGSVEFLDSNLPIALCGGSAGRPLTGAQATCSLTYTATGTHPITAQYLGDANYSASAPSASVTQVVNADATTLALSSTSGASSAPAKAGSSVAGQILKYTATVSANLPGSGTPGGTVSFTYTPHGGAPTSLCANVALVNGQANCVDNGALNSAGSPYTLGATYSQAANFLTSNTSVVENVLGATTTSLTAPASSPFGTPVSLTATVKAVAPATGTPPGTVTFYVGAAVAGTAALSAVKVGVASATIVTWGLQGGAQALSAVYSGAANFGGSTGTANDTVTFSQSISGTSTGNLVVSAGQQVLLTGKVTGSVTVNPGGALEVSGGSIGGSVNTLAALGVTLCGAKVAGALSVNLSIGYVLIGGGPGCPANTISGAVSLIGNVAGVEVASSVFGAGLSVSLSLGYGPLQQNGAFPPVEIAGNTVTGTLACLGNVPAPIDAGQPNNAAARTGQCASPTF